MAVYQRSTGASMPIIGATLGHRAAESTAVYARVDYRPVLDSATRATRAMLTDGK